MTTHTTTPSREEMIDYITLSVSKKELQPSRIIKFTAHKAIPVTGNVFFKDPKGNITEISNSNEYKIFLEPVTIGDILDYISKNGSEDEHEKVYGFEQTKLGTVTKTKSIFTLWEELREPLHKQSDDCVKFIYSLISD